MNNLILQTANEKNIEDALRVISQIDGDFNGENGPEYLWDSATGFSSNMEYLIHKTKNLLPIQRVSDFLSAWLADDGYYRAWDYSLTVIDDNYILSLAVVV